MPPSNSQNAFRRGVASIALLSLLRKEDMYGYQLVQELAANSDGVLNIQEGSLYPALYKLEEQGFISEKRVRVGKRMTRVYYHLEPAGEEHLDALIQDYEQITFAVKKIIKEGEKKDRA